MCIRYVPVGTSSYETDAVPRQTVPARAPRGSGWLCY